MQRILAQCTYTEDGNTGEPLTVERYLEVLESLRLVLLSRVSRQIFELAVRRHLVSLYKPIDIDWLLPEHQFELLRWVPTNIGLKIVG